MAFLFKVLVFGGIAVAIAAYSWKTGSEVMRQEVQTLTTRNQALETELNRNREQLTAAKTEEALLRSKLPTADEQSILEAVRQRLGAGVTAARLVEVVSAATASRKCDNSPVTKRFHVKTPISGQVVSSATFADNTITVSAEGSSAVSAGSPEAWFEPTKPVTLTIMHINGSASRAEGVLPITHSVAIGNSEYRFQFQPGPRGLVVATVDRCDYP